jgi:hypothetical protein
LINWCLTPAVSIFQLYPDVKIEEQQLLIVKYEVKKITVCSNIVRNVTVFVINSFPRRKIKIPNQEKITRFQYAMSQEKQTLLAVNLFKCVIYASPVFGRSDNLIDEIIKGSLSLIEH